MSRCVLCDAGEAPDRRFGWFWHPALKDENDPRSLVLIRCREKSPQPEDASKDAKVSAAHPDESESLDELLEWYCQRYTKQMCIGSGISKEHMEHNASVLRDAINSYRDWRKYF